MLIPWCVLDLLTGNTLRGVLLLVLYVIIAVIRNLLEPKLVGERFDLHPVATLAAIYVGGQLFGVIGILLLPMTLIVVRRMQSDNTGKCAPSGFTNDTTSLEDEQ